MSTSAAPAPERTEPARDGAPGRTRNDGNRGPDRDQAPTPDPDSAPDRQRDRDGRPAGEVAAAPLWLLAGVEQDEGPEPHIRRGID